MKLIVHGLGKMGMQIAEKLAADGHEVIAHNRSHEPIDQAAGFGATPAYTKDEALAAFNGEPVSVWLMLPDTVVDGELHAWLDAVPAGSLLVDGGNSDFRLTKQRAEAVTAKGMRFMDVGTSGGILGREQGFCMMAGGERADYDQLEPALKSLAAPRGSYRYFGPHGAGHFVKMVHNAIEYGMMESLAEGFHVLKAGPYANLDLAEVADTWQHASVIESLLTRLSGEVFRQNPELEGADGYVNATGEAAWTLEVGKQQGIPMPAIQAAMDVRLRSQQGQVDFSTKYLAELRHAFGGHDINKRPA